MNITSEDILNRKAQLEEDLEATLSKANAISGAIQDCDYWLELLAREEVEEKQDEKTE